MTGQRLNVLCFGEVLWDVLPDGRHAGGAPMNVAYHLCRLGVDGWPVSSVGDDQLGRELKAKLASWHVPRDLVGTVRDMPTGTVQVMLENGLPTYDIVRDVAWDQIDVPESLPAGCEPVAALVYGSLALREEYNRKSLLRLLDHASDTIKVFDVNLRAPFDDRDLAWRLARASDFVKLNDEELVFLLERDDALVDLETSARELAERANVDRVSVTCGADGAGFLDRGSWFRAASRPVTVRDTIGAGDSFLAALVTGTLTSPDQPEKNLRFASELAGFVASSDGATPSYEIREGRIVSA